MSFLFSVQLDMERYKAAKKTPTPLVEAHLKNGIAKDISDCTSTTAIWTTEQCVAQIADCVTLAAKSPRNEVLESFDKDDGTYMYRQNILNHPL